MTDLNRLLLVVLGGGAGAGLRFLVGLLAPAAVYPWHTFGINVAGSFALGLAAATCRDRPGWFALLGAGMCGGFTTFSTFSLETLTLIDEGRFGRAAGYVLGSVAAGLLGCWLGLRVGRG